MTNITSASNSLNTFPSQYPYCSNPPPLLLTTPYARSVNTATDFSEGTLADRHDHDLGACGSVKCTS